jgi:protein-disulfide isomerase-like protein with CxxC motif
MEAFVNEDTVRATWGDFLTASNWGIRGFPTVIARSGNQGHIIAHGYARADDMERVLMAAISAV